MDNFQFYEIVDRRITELIGVFKDNDFLKKQNGSGKKSFGFLLWFLEKYLPETELSELDKFITEGEDDSSCDIIFSNSDQLENEIFYVVQAKWFAKQNINSTNGINREIRACLSDFRMVLGGKKNSNVNQNFNRQYEKLIEHKRNNGKIKFVFLALCDGSTVKLDEYIGDFITSLVSFEFVDFYTLKQQFIEIEYKGIKTHNPLETPYIPRLSFRLEFEINQNIYISNPFKSCIFIVRPKQIYELFEKFGQSLFYKNIRNPLPSSYFNEEIENTILNNPINFWYFNNGITAITENIADFHADSTCVDVKGVQVINGAQTVYSIYKAYKFADDSKRSLMNEHGRITLRIVTTGGEDFDLKVTRYTNSQNPISERDFHANDEVQKRLQYDFFKSTNIWYETRRGEFRKKAVGVLKITNESFAQCYLAYYLNAPHIAKQNKKFLFVSKDIDKNGQYEFIFNDNTKYDDLLIAYYLNSFINNHRNKMKAEIKNIDTNNMTKEEEVTLTYDFIQYSNFEILALFKVLLYILNEGNIKIANSILLSSFSSQKLEKVSLIYHYIREFVREDLLNRKSLDSKIVNSVLFKSKEYYPSLKHAFQAKLQQEKESLGEMILYRP